MTTELIEVSDDEWEALKAERDNWKATATSNAQKYLDCLDDLEAVTAQRDDLQKDLQNLETLLKLAADVATREVTAAEAAEAKLARYVRYAKEAIQAVDMHYRHEMEFVGVGHDDYDLCDIDSLLVGD